jgi:hypothetical protein
MKRLSFGNSSIPSTIKLPLFEINLIMDKAALVRKAGKGFG